MLTSIALMYGIVALSTQGQEVYDFLPRAPLERSLEGSLISDVNIRVRAGRCLIALTATASASIRSRSTKVWHAISVGTDVGVVRSAFLVRKGNRSGLAVLDYGSAKLGGRSALEATLWTEGYSKSEDASLSLSEALGVCTMQFLLVEDPTGSSSRIISLRSQKTQREIVSALSRLKKCKRSTRSTDDNELFYWESPGWRAAIWCERDKADLKANGVRAKSLGTIIQINMASSEDDIALRYLRTLPVKGR